MTATPSEPIHAPSQTSLAERDVAREIAVRLKEPNRGLIYAMVQRLGTRAALELLEEVEQAEAHGGVPTVDGSRRRTPGGAFIYFAKTRLRGSAPRPQRPPTPPPPPPPDPFVWDDRGAYFSALQEETGVAGSAKLTVTGRPGKIMRRGDIILALLRNDKAPALPKGLPTPPTPTEYLVYMTAKQWARVSAALSDPADILIIEGYPAFDDRLKALSLFALNVTTRATQAAKRPKATPPEEPPAPNA